jgi:hypothetical protein
MTIHEQISDFFCDLCKFSNVITDAVKDQSFSPDKANAQPERMKI